MRNQGAKDASDVPGGRPEDEELDGGGDRAEPPSRLSPVTSRGKRKQERANKPKPNEMTEDEMIDLALRLSKQEASVVAVRRQKEEEEAVMKAIRESMTQQTGRGLPGETEPPPAAAGTRRKLQYSNGKSTPAVGEDASGAAPKDQKRGAKRRAGDGAASRKRRRRDGSPPPEAPDSSQTRDAPPARASPSGSDVLLLDSPQDQSPDSTQVGEPPLHESPVFPSSLREAEVHVPRLDRGPLRSRASSGFAGRSQDASSLKTPPTRRRSPAFPRSPERGSERAFPDSLASSEGGPEDGGESGPGVRRSPVFGPGSPPGPRGPRAHSGDSVFVISSQESLGGVSRQPPSPVFPKSPAGFPAACESPWSSGSGEGGDERLGGGSPASDGTGRPPRDRLEERIRGVSERGDSGDAERRLSSDMTLAWSDEDEDVTQVDSPSPVFPEERPAPRAEAPPPAPHREAPPTPPGSAVHYYWGVPFCPRGLDPDSYTQVILAQMEVYEKSLKRAQRGLLRKAEWGGGLVPQPEKPVQSTHLPSAGSPQEDFSRRRVLRLRGKPRDAGDAPEEEEGGGEEGEAEDERAEKRREEDGGARADADDCRVCPETPLSDEDATRDVIVVAEEAAAARASPEVPPESPELLDVDTILQDDSPAAADEQLEEADIDALLESNSEGHASDGGGGEEGAEPEETGGQQRATPPDPRPPDPREPPPDAGVDCPICQRSFPIADIEVHAAYCDGEEAATAAAASRPAKPRRKRARKAEPGEEDASGSCSAVREKCYVCQAAVPLRDYGRHTELCIGQREAEARQRAGTRGRPPGEESRNVAFPALQKENLLSALDKSESRDSEARASGSDLRPGYVIDLLNADEEDEGRGAGEAALGVSDSPIRSFTPISEAADCLIDFRKQRRPGKLSRRRR